MFIKIENQMSGLHACNLVLHTHPSINLKKNVILQYLVYQSKNEHKTAVISRNKKFNNKK